MKQTAVEWLEQRIRVKLTYEQDVLFDELFEQAKAMEQEQIKDAFVECWKVNVPDGIECKLDAEQYYNKTFKSENIVMFMTPENGEIESIILTDNPDCGVKGITFK